jgi:hypothetical protein
VGQGGLGACNILCASYLRVGLDSRSERFEGWTIIVPPCLLKITQKSTDMNTAKIQLELSFENPGVKLARLNQRPRRLARAHWWFEQMHAVVDRAFDWSAAPAARPEQVCLGLARGR